MSETGRVRAPVYVGAFLDTESQWRLLAASPPRHANVYAEHVTLAYKPSAQDMEAKWSKLLGRTVDVVVKAFAVDDRGHAARVWVAIDCDNAAPHVTISTAAGVKPVYSNELLKDVDTSGAVPLLRLRAVVDVFPRTKRI